MRLIDADKLKEIINGTRGVLALVLANKEERASMMAAFGTLESMVDGCETESAENLQPTCNQLATIVRCEDCRYWRKADTEAPDRKWCYAHANYFTPDFFCAYGEREENATN